MTVKVNVLVSWTCHVTMMVIGFFLMPYILGTVGDQAYGTWVFLNAIAGYSGLLYLGFGDAIARYVSKHHAREEWDELNEVVSGIFAAYCVSGLVAVLGTLVVVLVAPWIGDWDGATLREVQGAMLILGINAAVSIVGSTNGGVLFGIQRFDIEKAILIFGLLVKLVLTLTCLSAQLPLVTLALIFASHTFLEQILYYVLARKLVPTLRISWRLVRWSTVRESYGFAMFSSISLVAAKLIYDTDYIVIGLALGQAAIVPYAIGSRLSEMIRRPILQIGEVFLPRASQLHTQANHDILRSLLARGMGVAFLLSAGLFIGGGYFGPMLINLWMGPEYPQSHLIFLILIASQMIAAPVGILHMVPRRHRRCSRAVVHSTRTGRAELCDLAGAGSVLRHPGSRHWHTGPHCSDGLGGVPAVWTSSTGRLTRLAHQTRDRSTSLATPGLVGILPHGLDVQSTRDMAGLSRDHRTRRWRAVTRRSGGVVLHPKKPGFTGHRRLTSTQSGRHRSPQHHEFRTQNNERHHPADRFGFPHAQ